ncbi:zinc ribbon domain-containing protein [Kallotenue papyrolyticum]|uniref:zinc ribbon domain-containing protein n=1 Tax=Kallotenue papyrolyticum TaxID=1325125 RepID=UPI0004785551|nr:zinc ribbon domain-containing protein [Kallotenue papyrolyticum]
MESVQTFLQFLQTYWQTMVLVVLAYYLLLLFAVAVWTYRDIRSRTQDITAQVLAVALVLVLQLPGLILYLLMRPKLTLAEKYERALEEEYLRRDLEDGSVCPGCQRSVEAEFVVCPYCLTELRRRCQHCERTIDLTWQVCPYCGATSGAPAAGTPTIHIPAQERNVKIYS